MYLHPTTRHKDGKAHTYRQLVRLVRVGETVRQQTIFHLGELDAQGRARAVAAVLVNVERSTPFGFWSFPQSGRQAVWR